MSLLSGLRARTSRRIGSAGPRRRWWSVRAEAMESRVLLASVAWDGGGDGVNWSDARNWSGDQLPTMADDVTVAAAAGVTVQIAGTQFAHSLSSSALLRLTGGTLSVATTADVSADFTL